jgi:hypothetical protein
VSHVKYELGFYIPEDDILHSHRRENLNSYTEMWPFSETCNPVDREDTTSLGDCVITSPLSIQLGAAYKTLFSTYKTHSPRDGLP